MKKNPLVLLLSISFVFFLIFVCFVFFAVGSFVKDGEQFLALNKGNIGVVPLEGVILDSRKVIKRLKKLEKDESIKGVIIRMNSPGGAVAPSQEIYDYVKKLRKKKPVVASMESVAASGAYYIAVACDAIIANPGSMTGSIGVIMQFANLSKLYSWAKMERYVIKSGKFKDTGSDNRKMTEEERALMQEMIDDVHGQFVDAVAEGRSLKKKIAAELANGRIYSGNQAKEFKLVDKLGSIQVAVDEIKELAEIDGEAKLVYPSPKRRSLVELFSSKLADSIVTKVSALLGLENFGDLKSKVSIPNGTLLYLWQAQ